MIRACDIPVCPICGFERHRIYEAYPKDNRILLACNFNHIYVIFWEES